MEVPLLVGRATVAACGTSQIYVNATQVSDHHGHPVYALLMKIISSTRKWLALTCAPTAVFVTGVPECGLEDPLLLAAALSLRLGATAARRQRAAPGSGAAPGPGAAPGSGP